MEKIRKIRFVLFFILILSINILSSEKEDSLHIKWAPYLNSKYNYGFELNPGLVLYAVDKNATVISAGFSIFPKNRKSEFSIPIVLECSKDGDWFGGNYSGQSINIGFHYRHFLIGKVGGIYTSIGAKYNYANLRYDEYYENDKTRILSRLGVGFGVGYRIFSDDRIYWGIGLLIGGYYLGRDISNRTGVDSIFTRSERSFITIQLLKVGYAFNINGI